MTPDKDFSHLNCSLGLSEALATEYGLPDSQQAMSDRFDEDVAPAVIKQFGADDDVAMSEAFNNWSDAMCKDGSISYVQYDQYCYVGEYSEV